MKRVLPLWVLLGLVGFLLPPVSPAQEAAGPEAQLSIADRGRMIFKALKADPPDAAALRKALHDIGHVEAEFASEPLTRWVDGAQIVRGRIVLSATLGLNRRGAGDPPEAWIARLTAPLKTAQRAKTLKLAFAVPTALAQQRDRCLAAADAALRAGLVKLAEKYTQLNKTNWGTLAQAVAGKARPGRVSVWVGHYAGSKSGSRTPVAKADSYNVFILLRPLHWPVPAGEWAMNQTHSHLALMGQVHTDAGDPELRGALAKLAADALAPLERLNDRAAGRAVATQPAATQPTTQPATSKPAATSPAVSSRARADGLARMLHLTGAQQGKVRAFLAAHADATPAELAAFVRSVLDAKQLILFNRVVRSPTVPAEDSASAH